MYQTYPVYTEGAHAGGFLVSEANGWRSRDNGVLAHGQANVPAGTVVGAVTTETTQVQTVTVGGSPTGGMFGLVYQEQETAPVAYNASAATVQAALQALPNVGAGNMTVSGSAGGPYTVTAAGALVDQNLTELQGDGSLLTGGTNPSITVAITTQGEPAGRFAAVNLTASDGSQTAMGILYATTDATNSEMSCVVISRDAEVNGAEISYPSGASVSQVAGINALLADKGIIVRAAV